MCELTTPFVEFGITLVKSSVAVVESFFRACKLGAAGPYLGFSLILDFKGRLFSGELGLATGGLGGEAGVLDDGTGVGASLSLARRYSPLTKKVARSGAKRESRG